MTASSLSKLKGRPTCSSQNVCPSTTALATFPVLRPPTVWASPSHVVSCRRSASSWGMTELTEVRRALACQMSFSSNSTISKSPPVASSARHRRERINCANPRTSGYQGPNGVRTRKHVAMVFFDFGEALFASSTVVQVNPGHN